jgi:hypothetical protein
MKLVKNTVVPKPVLDNICIICNGITMENIGLVTITRDNHMVVIWIYVGKKIMKDVMLNGGFEVNIIIKQFIVN